MLLAPLYQHAQTQPAAPAIHDDRGTLSFGALAVSAAAIAKLLATVTTKQRVGVVLPSSGAFAACFYGSLLAGKTLVPINFLLSPQQIMHILQDAGVDTILSAPPLAEKFQFPGVKTIDLTTLPQPTAPIPLPPLPAVDPNATAVLLYTSATTGLPKGVALTHANLQSTVQGCIDHVFRGSNHRFLGLVPLFHSTGFTGTLLAPIQLGAPVRYLGRFSPVKTLETIREDKSTIVIGVPSMYQALLHLKSASPEDLAHVFALICGGEPLNNTLRDKFEARFNKPLLQGYGLTETCGPISVNTPEIARTGSVGKLIPGAQIKLDPDNNEILFSGPTIFRGYLNNEDASKTAFTGDGFFRTGDIGHVDEEGFLFITGRAKDMIIVSGEKLFPRELEELLMRNDAIADVAVAGRKDESRGEAPVAFIVLKEGAALTADQVKSFLRDTGAPSWKLPRDIVFLPELPRSPTGKVLKKDLIATLGA
jgi:long-chain acyl-CoA synthetase